MKVRDLIDSNFLYYYGQGKNHEAYKVFGAHLVKKDGKNIGCEFCLYAPNAKSVSIVGEWNDFKPNELNMECVCDGIWYLYLEGDYEWKRYKYYIVTKQDEVKYKADPYAFYAALRPLNDSRVYDIEGYRWNDADWMYTHPKTYDKPVLIYELHLGSWKRKFDEGDGFLSFSEIAPLLIDYLKEFGYTHVEILPVYEHPLDASWGYQGTSYYAITPRYGDPKGFMYFIDQLHQNGIGVIMDWVPGHICRDAHGLYMFDGTPLYDYADATIRENVEWGTANLDLGKGLTKSFLYSNAVFYMNYFHVDGFRVDAVSNLLYYLGDTNRGENVGAKDFLRGLSEIIFKKDDRVLLMAEDSSSYPGVTKPVDMGGVGFNYKWDMGWMNDTLSYFKLDPIYRKYSHHKLTFSMMYYYNEQFVLPFSHDEVVHMKGSLLNKMPGDYWQQFANYRLLIGYMMTHPGKKLLFMGNELATYNEWAFNKSLNFDILKYPSHDAAHKYVKDITNLYKNSKALWELDYDRDGFLYIDADNMDQSMYVYARFAKNKDDHLLVIMNCTPNTYDGYRIGVPGYYDYEEVMNSDKDIYGGSNRVNPIKLKCYKASAMKQEYAIDVCIPPLGIAIFKAVKKRKPRTKKEVSKKVEESTKKTTRKRKSIDK